jgi:hypothetical protein
MVEPRKTVFISCGQFTEEEKALGKEACELVKILTPFEGYFAENQTTLQALSENILRRLHESVGLIVIMHHRGKIEGRDITRASVWIEQEVAIATLMEQILHRPLHVALFVQRGTAIEGIRQQLQLNAVPFITGEEVIARLREQLPLWKEPLYQGDEERQKLADSVLLSIATSNGHDRNYTIQVENHSKVDVEVKCISLWSKNQTVRVSDSQRVSKPVFLDKSRGMVPAERTIPIQFDAKEDVAYRLWQLAGSPRLERQNLAEKPWLEGRFNAEVRVLLHCEVLGIEKEFEETRTVQVDFLNRQITGL